MDRLHGHDGMVAVRILVVEDSVKMAALLEKGLRQHGYAVDVVGSGQDAIWMATEHEYDAMVLDVILGLMTPSLMVSRCAVACAAPAAGPRCSW